MTYVQLSDQLLDALHDYAIAKTILQRRLAAVAVLVGCYNLHLRYPRSARRVIAAHRTLVSPDVTRDGVLMFIAISTRQGKSVPYQVQLHLFQAAARAHEDREHVDARRTSPAVAEA